MYDIHTIKKCKTQTTIIQNISYVSLKKIQTRVQFSYSGYFYFLKSNNTPQAPILCHVISLMVIGRAAPSIPIGRDCDEK